MSENEHEAAEREFLRAALEDAEGARRVAAESADRFRDVVSEVLGLDWNPGDDELVSRLRAMHGKTGPEPRRWRDFVTGAKAHLENSGLRWMGGVAREVTHPTDEATRRPAPR